MAEARKKFWQQILIFNHSLFMVAAAVVIACSISLCVFPVPVFLKYLLLLIIVSMIWFSAGSLFFSYLIYDRSDLYRFNWLKPYLAADSKLFNIYSGYSEGGVLLNKTFPDISITHFDFFDPAVSVTTSIKKAQELSVPLQSVRASPGSLGTGQKATVILFMQSLHELRTKGLKVSMLKECIAHLQPKGKIIIAEHFCNLNNFLIYGPGVFHFFGRRHWEKVIRSPGLITERSFRITPFIHIYILQSNE